MTGNQSGFKKQSFQWGDKKYHLREAVCFDVKYEKPLWVYDCPRYKIHTFSYNQHDALNQLDEDFDFLYNGLVEEDDENLTRDAIELKRILEKDILEVIEV